MPLPNDYCWAQHKGDVMENKELKDNIRQYLALKDQLDLITKRQTEIKQRLIDAVDAVEHKGAD